MTEKYILNVGRSTLERQALLNEIYGPYTHEFFESIGLKKGMSVLDVGCGIGSVSFWLSEKIGNEGKIIGIDISPEQIQLAKEKAYQQHCINIDFRVLSVHDLEKITETFDIVFSRFLLIHIKHPEAGLKLMYDRVKPGGMLVCDEPSFSASFCYPFSDSFELSKKLMLKAIKPRGFDFDFGQKIYSLFKKFNLDSVLLRVVQPSLTNPRHKMFWPLAFEGVRAEFLSHHIVDEKQFNEMIQNLMEVVKDDNSYILPMSKFQVVGYK